MTDLRTQGLPRDGLAGAIAANHARKRIGLILFDGFSLLLAGAVIEALQFANILAVHASSDRSIYDIHLMSTNGGSVSSASSVFVQTEKYESNAYAACYDAVFVAAGAGEADAQERGRDVDWVSAVIDRAEMVVPIGHGERLLEAARPVWRRSHGGRTADQRERLQRLTGSTSPVEVALALVERDLGSEIARRVAQRVELPARWHTRALEGKRADAKLSERIQTSTRWIEANASRAITIDEAAQVALMSTRNFLRRFKVETGLTPSEYLLHVRIDWCCRLLATTSLPVDKVARRCGIGSGAQLSKIFRKHLGRTPTEYRARLEEPNALS